MSKLRKLRIGLFDHYGGGMPIGWTRLIFKNFEFPFVEDSYNDVFPPDINAGNLRAKYDVLVFNDASLGGGGGRGGGGGGGGGAGAGGCSAAAGATARGGGAGAAGAAAGRRRTRAGGGAAAVAAALPGSRAGDDRPRRSPIPEKYTKRQGNIDAAGVAALQQFVNDGGTIIAIGSAANSAVQHVQAAADRITS